MQAPRKGQPDEGGEYMGSDWRNLAAAVVAAVEVSGGGGGGEAQGALAPWSVCLAL